MDRRCVCRYIGMWYIRHLSSRKVQALFCRSDYQAIVMLGVLFVVRRVRLCAPTSAPTLLTPPYLPVSEGQILNNTRFFPQKPRVYQHAGPSNLLRLVEL